MSVATSQSPHVLLVENDLFFASRILSALDKAGYMSERAANREEAERKLGERSHSLVIINLASPALGGTELIRQIKSHRAAGEPPKVLAYLSHIKIPDNREEVMAAGTDKLCANSAISMRLPDLVRDVLAGRGPSEEG